MSEVLFTTPQGKRVLAGLRWSTDPNGFAQGDIMNAAREAGAKGIASRADEKNYALIDHDTPIDDMTAGVSFAAGVADAIGDPSWCGIFEADGRFIYIAVIDTCIAPDSDRILDEASALALLETEAQLFDAIWAPRQWAIAQSNDSDVLLGGIDWETVQACKGVTPKRSVRPILVAGAALAVALGAALGLRYWHQTQAEADAAAQLAAAQARAKARTVPPPTEGWRQQPTPQAAASQCMAERAAVAETTHQGWSLDTLVCDFSSKIVTASLTPYTNSALQPIVTGYTTAIAPDGQKVLLNGQLKIPPTNRQSEQRSTTALFAARNFLMSFDPPGRWNDTGHQAQFSLSSPLAVDVLAAGLGRYPTTTVTRIVFDKETWRVEGVIYY